MVTYELPKLPDYEVMSKLTPREMTVLGKLANAYRLAKLEKNYRLSDKLRYKLMKWDSGILGAKKGTWFPHFEDSEHYHHRVKMREKHNEAVY